MKTPVSVLVLSSLLALTVWTTGDLSGSPAGYVVAGTPTTTNAAEGPEVVEDSMHEFMEYVFQPTYRRLKVTMAAEPVDNSGWKALKSDSLILAESCNLLFARLPEKNADDWARHATASRSEGSALYQAARGKDFVKATSAYKRMLNNCNACHRQFENGKHILVP
ncbi:MAG: hypothetical protein ABGZ23_08325 [Fuerstiella sp.]|nr:hypothetical protein [Fuerstiella sp.]